MKFFKKTRKGFTLVELIVVIAIVAILAAVSVVSYIAFINKGNESADIQLVKQLNVALQADEALNGPRDTMHEMLGAMEENGFVVENLTKTKSGYDIVWDQEHNRFGLLNGNNLVYGESTYNSAKAWNIWKFADTKDEAENKSYSVYLTEEFANTNVNVTELEIKAGLDVGNYDKLTSISYENTSEVGQKVVIRTNSFDTRVILKPFVDNTDSKKGDHIEFFGNVAQVTGPKEGDEYIGFTCAFNSVKMNGRFVEVKVASGHVDVTDADDTPFPKYNDEGEIEAYNWPEVCATTIDVKATNGSDNNIHFHAEAGTAAQEKANADEMNNAVGDMANTGNVTWDYRENDDQNDKDVYHHVTNEGNQNEGNEDKGVWTNSEDYNSDEAAEENARGSVFNFLKVKDSIGYGETFRFVTTKENVVWSVDDPDLAYIESDGTLLACDFDAKVTVYAECDGKTISHEVNLTLFHGGTGEENDPYEIFNRYQFKYMWYGYQEYGGKLYYELVNDIDFEYTDPYSYAYRGIHLEGNNHILSNGTGPLFSQMNWSYDLYLSNFTIKNFVSNYSLICNYGAYNVSSKQVYDNIDVIDCTAKGGAFFLPWVYDNYDITFKNCDIKNSTVNNDVTCQGFVAGFVGNGKSTVTIDTCTMQANVVSSNPIVAGIIGSGSATVKNCSILPGTTITQKGSNTASAIGSATITNTTCYATIIKSTNSGVNKNGFDSTVAYLAQDLGFDASNFVVNADGSVEYTGSVEIAKLGIYQTITTNRLHDGEFENGGFPTLISDTVVFNNVSTGTIDNALNYITAVKNVTNQVADKLYCSIEELPEGLEFNDHGFVFDNGTLYLDANQAEDSYTSNYFAGTLKATDKATSINVTVYFVAYDANDNLLGTYTKSYSAVLDK